MGDDAKKARTLWISVCWATCAVLTGMTSFVLCVGLWMQYSFTEDMVDEALADKEHARSLANSSPTAAKFDITLWDKIHRPVLRELLQIRHVFVYNKLVLFLLVVSFVTVF